jgi:hypothetical protein
MLMFGACSMAVTARVVILKALQVDASCNAPVYNVWAEIS